MHESFQGHIQEQVQAQLQQLLAQQGNAFVLHSPGGHCSSCASRTDDLEESKECRLVTPVLGIQKTVAYGLARPLVEGNLFNSHPIPKGYAIVLVDRVKPGHHRSKLEYSGENGEWKHGKNIGYHVRWRKRDIAFGEEDIETSSSDSLSSRHQPLSPPPPEH
jgi:hypothetical protein